MISAVLMALAIGGWPVPVPAMSAEGTCWLCLEVEDEAWCEDDFGTGGYAGCVAVLRTCGASGDCCQGGFCDDEDLDLVLTPTAAESLSERGKLAVRVQDGLEMLIVECNGRVAAISGIRDAPLANAELD